jgi:hypothetical protein
MHRDEHFFARSSSARCLAPHRFSGFVGVGPPVLSPARAAAQRGDPGTLSAQCTVSANELPQTQTKQSHWRFIMKTLIIKDLARTEELDSAKMAEVRGGWKMNSSYYSFGDVTYAPSYDSSIDAVQLLMQDQEVMTATANGSAFVEDVNVTSNVSQDGQNLIIRK